MASASIKALRRILVAGLCLLSSLVGQAHPMPESRVWLDTTPSGAQLTLQLPLNRLEFAYGQPLADAPTQVLAKHGEGLSRYLLLHVGARSGNQGWHVLRPQLSVKGQDGAAELEAVLDLRAPAGADTRHFQLLYDAINHEVRTHRAQVYLRQDWEGGTAGSAPRLLGELTTVQASLAVDLAPQTAGASLLSLFKLGARHIAEGTDHLLFLLTLLLAAPVCAQGHRWVGQRSASAALRRVLGVVSAFTLGHSLTLALGTTGVMDLPSQWVEVAVAASILVAAVHAWRPLIQGGELLMAGGFGLLHGLAFASGMNGAGLSLSQQLQAVLSFNLGIEAVQLLVVLATLPPLLLLCLRAPDLYAQLRTWAAALTAVAATGWLVQRLLPEDPMPGVWLDTAASAAWPMAAGLWVLALAVIFDRRLPRAAEPHSPAQISDEHTHSIEPNPRSQGD